MLPQLTVQAEEGQVLPRRRLPRPRLIEVVPGDFAVLHVQRQHAAQGFLMGTRVSVQSLMASDKGRILVLDDRERIPQCKPGSLKRFISFFLLSCLCTPSRSYSKIKA